MSKVLEVKDLKVRFNTYAGVVQAVRGISFDLAEGETLAIVGESGCGKSITAKSIMRLLPTPPAEIDKNSKIICNGKDVLSLNKKELQKLRGGDVGMIFQDPMTSLNPLITIGNQIIEPLIIHEKLSKKEAFKKGVELLRLVNIPNPEKRMKQYPHEFSGGMRQRAMIAMALSCNPKLIIADEPTTALDVTIQAQILEIMKNIKNKLGTSIIFITHDLGVVADICDRVNVMYGGLIIEKGGINDIFDNPKHPYTWGLLDSVPSVQKERKRLKPIEGQPPDLLKPPKGCPFYARCKFAMNICREKMPEFYEVSKKHKVSCWLSDEKAPKVIRARSREVGL